MDFNAIIEPAIKFFSTGIGAMIAEFARGHPTSRQVGANAHLWAS